MFKIIFTFEDGIVAVAKDYAILDYFVALRQAEYFFVVAFAEPAVIAAATSVEQAFVVEIAIAGVVVESVARPFVVVDPSVVADPLAVDSLVVVVLFAAAADPFVAVAVVTAIAVASATADWVESAVVAVAAFVASITVVGVVAAPETSNFFLPISQILLGKSCK